MIQSIFRAITVRIGGLQQAAFWLALFSGFSLLLGFIRDRILAHYFGAGVELDIYYAAFKIPDLLFVTVASLVSISALVPLFARKETEGEKHLRDAADSLFTVFSFLIVISCVLAWFLVPYLVPFAFKGMSLAAQSQTIFLSRILLLSPLLLGFSNFFGSIVQYEKRFVLYSLSPLLYNLGIIAGLLFGVKSYGITAAVFGVCLGAFLHLFLQAAFILFSSRAPRLTFRIKWRDVWETAALSVPRTLALSIASFVGLFFAALSARIGEGTIAVFNLSFNLQSVPLSLIGVSFSLSAFPALALSFAKRNLPEVIAHIENGLRQIIFWALPLTALIIVLRAHIVRVILGSGSFDWNDTRLTAAALALFVISAVFQSIALFLSRSHYALGKTKWPLLANLTGGAVSVLAAVILIKYFDALGSFFDFLSGLLNVSHLPKMILALPFAFSIGSILSALLLLFALGKELISEIWSRTKITLLQSLISAFVAGLGAYLTLSLTDSLFNLETFLGVLGHGFLAGLIGIFLWALFLRLIGNQEIKKIISHD